MLLANAHSVYYSHPANDVWEDFERSYENHEICLSQNICNQDVF